MTDFALTLASVPRLHHSWKSLRLCCFYQGNLFLPQSTHFHRAEQLLLDFYCIISYITHILVQESSICNCRRMCSDCLYTLPSTSCSCWCLACVLLSLCTHPRHPSTPFWVISSLLRLCWDWMWGWPINGRTVEVCLLNLKKLASASSSSFDLCGFDSSWLGYYVLFSPSPQRAWRQKITCRVGPQWVFIEDYGAHAYKLQTQYDHIRWLWLRLISRWPHGIYMRFLYLSFNIVGGMFGRTRGKCESAQSPKDFESHSLQTLNPWILNYYYNTVIFILILLFTHITYTPSIITVLSY